MPSSCLCARQIVDSLDTLWLMDMKAEYRKARDWVADVLDFQKCAVTSPHRLF